MNLSRVMREFAFALVAILALGAFASAGTVCERGKTWWNLEAGSCVPCRKCERSQLLAVRIPCEPHRDTICQSIQEVKIWPFHTHRRVYQDNSELSDYEYDVEYDDMVVSKNDEVGWDLQTSTLTLAASGCVVFFVVVVFLSLSHARHWKKLKQALKSDVQDLSAKLKLMEAGDAQTQQVSTDHHIYCNIHVTKDSLHNPSVKKLGNVYTQEKHST